MSTTLCRNEPGATVARHDNSPHVLGRWAAGSGAMLRSLVALVRSDLTTASFRESVWHRCQSWPAGVRERSSDFRIRLPRKGTFR
jgi:hypothetical protein